MGNMSALSADMTLNALLRGVTMNVSNDKYLALFLSDPGEDGSSGIEVSKGGYIRRRITFSGPVRENGKSVCKNDIPIVYPIATEDYGNVIFGGIYDAAEGGRYLYKANVGPKQIDTGDRIEFAIGGVSVTQE